MNNYDSLNNAINILLEKHKNIEKFIITTPLIPGQDPPYVDLNEMEKAYKEYNLALDEYRKELKSLR
jgi:hypothetical protein